jgi:hypothetical protein
MSLIPSVFNIITHVVDCKVLVMVSLCHVALMNGQMSNLSSPIMELCVNSSDTKIDLTA